jgi:hypothetical protein
MPLEGAFSKPSEYGRVRGRLIHGPIVELE